MRHWRDFDSEEEAKQFVENMNTPWGHEQVNIFPYTYHYHDTNIEKNVWRVTWVQWTS